MFTRLQGASAPWGRAASDAKSPGARLQASRTGTAVHAGQLAASVVSLVGSTALPTFTGSLVSLLEAIKVLT